MAIDPTKWTSPMHAWKYWHAEAERHEKEVYEISEGYYADHQDPVVAKHLRNDDDNFKHAVSLQQFSVQQAGLYADAVLIRLLSALLAEIRAHNIETDRG